MLSRRIERSEAGGVLGAPSRMDAGKMEDKQAAAASYPRHRPLLGSALQAPALGPPLPSGHGRPPAGRNKPTLRSLTSRSSSLVEKTDIRNQLERIWVTE